MFKKNSIYYNTDNGYKLKYIDQCLERYYHFKILQHDDPDNDWMEYSTKDGSEIVKTKKELDDVYVKPPTRTEQDTERVNEGQGRVDPGVHEGTSLPEGNDQGPGGSDKDPGVSSDG